MFIYNVKINGSKVFKAIFVSMVILLICIIGVVIFKIFAGAKDASSNSSCVSNNVCKISTTNYTNVLKAVHDDVDSYIGTKFTFSGYIYKVMDLTDNQFILARDMIISSDFQSVVVGFLCESDEIKNFADNTWVEITGEIVKGDYHGVMPIVKVTKINTVSKPNDEYVYPPDESYIPTSGIV